MITRVDVGAFIQWTSDNSFQKSNWISLFPFLFEWEREFPICSINFEKVFLLFVVILFYLNGKWENICVFSVSQFLDPFFLSRRDRRWPGIFLWQHFIAISIHRWREMIKHGQTKSTKQISRMKRSQEQKIWSIDSKRCLLGPKKFFSREDPFNSSKGSWRSCLIGCVIALLMSGIVLATIITFWLTRMLLEQWPEQISFICRSQDDNNNDRWGLEFLFCFSEWN